MSKSSKLQRAALASLVIGLLAALPATAAAQTASSGWHNPYGFSGNTRRQADMVQADLIAKREAGYYDNIGKVTYNSSTVTTNTYGSYIESTTNVNGDTLTNINGDGNTSTGGSNAVHVGGTNSGDLNGSVNHTTRTTTRTTTNYGAGQ